MQITNGNFQVLDGNNALVGYWLSGDVSGTLYDWFARDVNKTMAMPLDMQNHTLKYIASEQTWHANSSGWTAAQWESGFSTFLDGKFGATNWKKLDKYKCTKLTW